MRNFLKYNFKKKKENVFQTIVLWLHGKTRSYLGNLSFIPRNKSLRF